MPSSTKSAEIKHMTKIKNSFYRLLILKDTRGQDLIEYALMAGFVAVAAGAIMPGVSTNISRIFSKVGSVLANAQVPN
jgi:pilus assembly protein Flp/PilA